MILTRKLLNLKCGTSVNLIDNKSKIMIFVCTKALKSSCKTTVLSWMAKDGSFTISERQIMGHHLDKPSVSALTYGRQNFIPILIKTRKMLDRIAAKVFLPDAKPSAMISRAIQAEEQRSDEMFRSMGMPLKPQDEDDSASEVADMEDLEHETVGLIPASERRLVAIKDPEISSSNIVCRERFIHYTFSMTIGSHVVAFGEPIILSQCQSRFMMLPFVNNAACQQWQMRPESQERRVPCKSGA